SAVGPALPSDTNDESGDLQRVSIDRDGLERVSRSPACGLTLLSSSAVADLVLLAAAAEARFVAAGRLFDADGLLPGLRRGRRCGRRRLLLDYLAHHILGGRSSRNCQDVQENCDEKAD